MSKINEKKRFNAFIQAETYDKVNEFVANNELITTRLTAGTILEIGLKLFFQEIQKKPLETIVAEQLIQSEKVGVESE